MVRFLTDGKRSHGIRFVFILYSNLEYDILQNSSLELHINMLKTLKG